MLTQEPAHYRLIKTSRAALPLFLETYYQVTAKGKSFTSKLKLNKAQKKNAIYMFISTQIYISGCRGVFRPRQTRQLPRAVYLKGRFLSCQSY